MKIDLEKFFFQKMDGRGLGLLRFFFFAAVLMVFAPMPMEKICQMPAALKTHSTILGDVNEFFKTSSSFESVLIIWRISLVLSMIGLFSIVSLPLAFISTGIVFSLHNAYSCGFHGGNLFFLGMGILMLSPAGRYFSLDSFISLKRGIAYEKQISAWPVKLIQINFVTMFFFAAIAKLINLGWGYVTADEFYSIILTKKTWGGSFSPIFTFLLDHPLITRFLGGYAFLLELFCPLVFLNKKVMTLIILSLAAMQLMIYLHLGISSFNAMPAIYAFWIDWDTVLGFYEKNKN